jgi:hypothetical protein
MMVAWWRRTCLVVLCAGAVEGGVHNRLDRVEVVEDALAVVELLLGALLVA